MDDETIPSPRPVNPYRAAQCSAIMTAFIILGARILSTVVPPDTSIAFEAFFFALAVIVGCLFGPAAGADCDEWLRFSRQQHDPAAAAKIQ